MRQRRYARAPIEPAYRSSRGDCDDEDRRTILLRSGIAAAASAARASRFSTQQFRILLAVSTVLPSVHGTGSVLAWSDRWCLAEDDDAEA